MIISIIISLIRGFAREALSLLTWGLAFWVTFTFSDRVSFLLSFFISAEPLRMGISIAVLFLVTLAIGIMVSYFLTKMVNKSGLSGTDRLVGLLFGASRGVLIIIASTLGLSLTPVAQSLAWQHSQFVPQVEPMVVWLSHDLPKYVQHHQKAVNSAQQTATDQVDDAIG